MLAHTVPYRTFEIPKANGGIRLIEYHEEAFNKVLKSLNKFLQCVYFYEPLCSFGFIINNKKWISAASLWKSTRQGLNNFCINGLDDEFIAFAHQNQITYICYVDDMNFC